MSKLIHNLSPTELHETVIALGEPAYRAGQIWQWLYRKHAAGWNAMGNVPQALRSALAERFSFDSCSKLTTSGMPDETRKILVGLRDGERVEEVLIPAGDRLTVCVSSQVGCKFKCAFCASGQSGFKRNLEAGEMVGQIMLAWSESGSKPDHVVFMGVGEPMDNYEAVLKSVRILNDADGLSIGARKITISTCGVIPGIRQLATEGLQVELSVSLHAPTDELRSKLMPANRKYPLKDLMKACRDYSEKTGRIITFEYTLIKDVNDSEPLARQLAHVLGGMQCRVNLIPLSQVKEFDGKPADPCSGRMFMNVLKKAGINATLRASRGGEVTAACGQLRASFPSGCDSAQSNGISAA